MKLIFCFDGTCNDPEDSGNFFQDSSISNVLKLHAFLGGSLDAIASKRRKKVPTTAKQHSFYYSGVGTRGGWLKQKFNAMFAPPYGDMDDILNEAEDDLLSNYKEGDEIYIFGFSRGAAIARMFAAHIKDKTVNFLGVFDTVAATRGSLDLNPDSYPASGVVFENGSVGKHVVEAVHLVSLDEKRITFQPTLFNKDERVTEIWFAGVHSDIGGGYWFDGLSDITLNFMIEQISADLTVQALNTINYNNLKIKGAQDSICADDLNIKPLVTGKIHEQLRTGLKAKTLAPRLVRVNYNDQPAPTELPILHHTVKERFQKISEYRPYALRDTNYKVLEKDGSRSVGLLGVTDL